MKKWYLRVLVLAVVLSMSLANVAYAYVFTFERTSVQEDGGAAKVSEADDTPPYTPHDITNIQGKSIVVDSESVTVELMNDTECLYQGGSVGTVGVYVHEPANSKDWSVEAKNITMKEGNATGALVGANISGEHVTFFADNIVVNNELGVSSGTSGIEVNKGNAIVKDITVNGNSDNTQGVIANNSASVTIEENLTVNNGSIISSNSGTGNVVNILGTADDTSKEYVLISASNEDVIELNVWKTDGDVKITTDSGVSSHELSDDKVNYIIKDKNETTPYRNMILSGGKYVEIKDSDGNIKHYYTATEGTITVTVKSGYKLNSSTGCTGSGRTYVVTIPEGGGVTLEAIVAEIERQSSGGSSTTYKKGWNQSGNNWLYVKPDGSLAKNEWLQIEVNGIMKWYHFGDDSFMDTGWFRDKDGSWYYLSQEEGQNAGAMQTGWMTDPYDGYRYYLDPVTGKMATGWAVVDGKKHYFNEVVPDASGWTQDASGDWVYEKRSIIPLGAMIQ